MILQSEIDELRKIHESGSFPNWCERCHCYHYLRCRDLVMLENGIPPALVYSAFDIRGAMTREELLAKHGKG